ncbi:hypothetical protein D918_04209 [Trichuris suis]|nr:hypothetical protein D918_04209 [Trichuris suis]
MFFFQLRSFEKSSLTQSRIFRNSNPSVILRRRGIAKKGDAFPSLPIVSGNTHSILWPFNRVTPKRQIPNLSAGLISRLILLCDLYPDSLFKGISATPAHPSRLVCMLKIA